MTYCVGILLKGGIVFASDSRTHAGVDNYAKFCKMTVFERPGDRVIVMLSSGSLAGTQAIVSTLKQQAEEESNDAPTLWTARTMFDVAQVISDATRKVEQRDVEQLKLSGLSFNASFIFGGQIKGERPRLFRTYAETNFIEAEPETPFLQTGETKYGKPILDRVITPETSLADGAKCALVSLDSTMRSNLSVGMPIDILSYERDSLKVAIRRRFEEGDPHFTKISRAWSEGVRRVFSELPALDG
jgi:putative proteasome-type protease